jgi:hypothetical protein
MAHGSPRFAIVVSCIIVALGKKGAAGYEPTTPGLTRNERAVEGAAHIAHAIEELTDNLSALGRR